MIAGRGPHARGVHGAAVCGVFDPTSAMILKANGFDAVCMKQGLRDWPGRTEIG
jgi:hypothetical protein